MKRPKNQLKGSTASKEERKKRQKFLLCLYRSLEEEGIIEVKFSTQEIGFKSPIDTKRDILVFVSSTLFNQYELGKRSRFSLVKIYLSQIEGCLISKGLLGKEGRINASGRRA